MKFTVNFLLILINCSFLATVNAKSLKPESKIVGGHEAKPHSHPYLVSLQTRFLWVRVHTCGGAILNERWVSYSNDYVIEEYRYLADIRGAPSHSREQISKIMTACVRFSKGSFKALALKILSAAHCATESWLIRWLPLDVVAGIHDIDNFGTKSQVIKISERIHHPLYEGGIGSYDIAVFRTVTPIFFTKWVQPINLPSNYKLGGGPMKLAGWGALKTTVFIPVLPSRLQEVKVTYIPYDECYAAIDKLKEGDEVNPLDRDANICTGPTSGGIAACSGDSGGPLIQYVPNNLFDPNDPVEDNTERYNSSYYGFCNEQTTETIEDATSQDRQYVEEFIPIVVGVVSWGVSPCGEKGAPTIYTNVSTYIDFINYNIRDV